MTRLLLNIDKKELKMGGIDKLMDYFFLQQNLFVTTET